MGRMLGARMLDGQRYFAEFPDEVADASDLPRKLLLSDELRVTLAAIEKELSEFIRSAEEGTIVDGGNDAGASSRDSAET